MKEPVDDSEYWEKVKIVKVFGVFIKKFVGSPLLDLYVL